MCYTVSITIKSTLDTFTILCFSWDSPKREVEYSNSSQKKSHKKQNVFCPCLYILLPQIFFAERLFYFFFCISICFSACVYWYFSTTFCPARDEIIKFGPKKKSIFNNSTWKKAKKKSKSHVGIIWMKSLFSAQISQPSLGRTALWLHRLPCAWRAGRIRARILGANPQSFSETWLWPTIVCLLLARS